MHLSFLKNIMRTVICLLGIDLNKEQEFVQERIEYEVCTSVEKEYILEKRQHY